MKLGFSDVLDFARGDGFRLLDFDTAKAADALFGHQQHWTNIKRDMGMSSWTSESRFKKNGRTDCTDGTSAFLVS